jgi:hypothetical protein
MPVEPGIQKEREKKEHVAFGDEGTKMKGDHSKNKLIDPPDNRPVRENMNLSIFVAQIQSQWECAQNNRQW